MKKTIAILLILVIGMVGVFAAPLYTDSKTVYLETSVLQINQMVVTSSSADFVWSDFGTTTSAHSTTATAYEGLSDGSNYNKDGVIATLHARSNNRNGFTVTMNVTPLVSTVGEASQYIDFVAKCGDAVVKTEGATVIQTEATVGTLMYGGSVMPILKSDISVNLSEKLAEAAEGTYTGSIIFSYSAT